MVMDFRKYAKNDFLSKVALISSNVVEEGGEKFLRLLRFSKKTLNSSRNGIVGVNYAGKVEGDQEGVIAGVNYAKEVGRDQGGVIAGVNYAGKVGRDQVGTLNIQTKNKHAYQRGLIKYNPLEKWGLGSSVWTKIKKTDKYLDKLILITKFEDIEAYKGILKEFADYQGSLIKRITGHNTSRDVLARQSRKRLKSLEKRLE